MDPSSAAPPPGEQPEVLEMTRVWMQVSEPHEVLEPAAREGLATPGVTFNRGTVHTPPAVVPSDDN